jgi:hypothetical protein
MDKEQRAEQIRSDIAKDCNRMTHAPAWSIAEEIERQAQRQIPYWDAVAAEARRRRAAGAR